MVLHTGKRHRRNVLLILCTTSVLSYLVFLLVHSPDPVQADSISASVATTNLLQELWELDQQKTGVQPLRPLDTPPASGGFLVVDEDVLSSSTGVSNHALFPVLEFAGPEPLSYQMFTNLVAEKSQILSIPVQRRLPEDVQDVRRLEDAFLLHISKSDVMIRAKEMLESIDDPYYRNQIGSEADWLNFLHRFWFTIPVAGTLGSTVAPPKESTTTIREMLERYRSKRESTWTVEQAINQIIDRSEGLITPDLFDLTAAQVRPKLQAMLAQERHMIEAPMLTHGRAPVPHTPSMSPPDKVQTVSAAQFLYALISDQIMLNASDSDPSPPFIHIMIGEYDKSGGTPVTNQAGEVVIKNELKGYHSWYKYYHEDQGTTANHVLFNGLSYGTALELLGKKIPELTTFSYTMRLTDGVDVLALEKRKGGFLNGISMEGLMAMCMVAFYGSRATPPIRNTFDVPEGTIRMVVHSGIDMQYPELMATAYPELPAAATPLPPRPSAPQNVILQPN